MSFTLQVHHNEWKLFLIFPQSRASVCYLFPCFSGWIPDTPPLLPPWWRALPRSGGWLRGGAGRLAQGTFSATLICGRSRNCSGQRGTRMRSRGPSWFGATGMRLNWLRPWLDWGPEVTREGWGLTGEAHWAHIGYEPSITSGRKTANLIFHIHPQH